MYDNCEVVNSLPLNSIMDKSLYSTLIAEKPKRELKSCVICRKDVCAKDPTASKDILKDFSLRTFTKLSVLLAVALQKKHEKIIFKV